MKDRLKGRGRSVAALAGVSAGMAALMMSAPVSANSGITPWQLGFQEPVTEIARQINDFHNVLMIIITLVTLFVMGLLAYVIWKFNETANPVPSKTTHHTLLEVAWTVVPIIILLIIAIPSFRLLYAQYDFPKADLVIKTTGNQWYWSYEYPDHNMSFDAVMERDGDDKPVKGADGAPRTLAVDNYMVVPVNKNVELLVTASDVIHNWTVPAFGVKLDAIPGRVMRAWFRAEKVGTYFGQCSELCGKDHAFMPIGVKVMSEADYNAWLKKAKEEHALHHRDHEPGGELKTTRRLAANNR